MCLLHTWYRLDAVRIVLGAGVLAAAALAQDHLSLRPGRRAFEP